MTYQPIDDAGLPTATEPEPTLGGPAFRDIFRRHPAGVAVISLSDGEHPVGFTATSVISVSADPPILAFSVADNSSSWPSLVRADTVVINFLRGEQVELSARFATRGIDRFSGVGWSRLPTGEPVLDGVAAWIRVRLQERTPVGSSFLITALALSADQGESSPPLVYVDRTYHHLGDHSAL